MVASGGSSGLCRECRLLLTGPTVLAEERTKLLRWWLRNYDDEEIADLARGLGVEGPSAERIAATRTRLRLDAGPRREQGVR